METTQYSSAEDGRIYQKRPVLSRPSLHQPKGWTETVEGYLNEAKKLSLCIRRNRKAMKRPYTWAVHINLNQDVPPKQVADDWTDTCRKLRRRGIVALWVREPNKANKVHYHLIVKNPMSMKELRWAIEGAMPPRSKVKWRLRVEPIRKEWQYVHYITKAKIGGYINGTRVEDRHRAKRLLFKPHLKFKKYGVIGDFWEGGKNKDKLWEEIAGIEQKIREGLERPNVRRLARHIHEYLGETVSLGQIERSVGYWSDGDAVQGWIDRLITDGWDRRDD
jgi:hypothetical protein